MWRGYNRHTTWQPTSNGDRDRGSFETGRCFDGEVGRGGGAEGEDRGRQENTPHSADRRVRGFYLSRELDVLLQDPRGDDRGIQERARPHRGGAPVAEGRRTSHESKGSSLSLRGMTRTDHRATRVDIEEEGRGSARVAVASQGRGDARPRTRVGEGGRGAGEREASTPPRQVFSYGLPSR